MPQPVIAASDVKLAEILDTDRKSLRRWRRDFPANCPRDLNVAEWRKFMQDNLLGPFSARMGYGGKELPADRSIPSPSIAATDGSAAAEKGEPDSLLDWKSKHEKLKCHRLQQKIQLEAGELTPTSDLEIALGQLLVAFRASLDHLPPSAARWVRGLTDFHAIVERLQAECDSILQGLYRAEYLGEILPGIVAAQPPPAGIAAETWRAALSDAVQGALRAIGRLALPSKPPADGPAPPPIIEAPAPAPAPVAAAKPRKPRKFTRPRRPRDDEATAHAQLKPTLAEVARRKRAKPR